MDELDEAIQDHCPGDKFLETFVKQMTQKGTSLLAAYAFKTCLERGKSV